MFFAVCSLLWFDSGVGLPFIRKKMNLRRNQKSNGEKVNLSLKTFEHDKIA